MNATSELGKVAVLMGGPSSEREISLLSGNAVLGALKSKGVDAHAYDPAQRPVYDLKREDFDRVFIALHGRLARMARCRARSKCSASRIPAAA